MRALLFISGVHLFLILKNFCHIFISDCNEWVYGGVDMDFMLQQRDFFYVKSTKCWYGSHHWESSVVWFWGFYIMSLYSHVHMYVHTQTRVQERTPLKIYRSICNTYLKWLLYLLSQVVRTTLMPGILKTVGHNKDHPKPIKVKLVYKQAIDLYCAIFHVSIFNAIAEFLISSTNKWVEWGYDFCLLDCVESFLWGFNVFLLSILFFFSFLVLKHFPPWYAMCIWTLTPWHPLLKLVGYKLLFAVFFYGVLNIASYLVWHPTSLVKS